MERPRRSTRRAFLATAGVAATLAAGYTAFGRSADVPRPVPVAESDWAFPGHDRRNSRRAPPASAPSLPLARAWEGSREGRSFEPSTPVVADGTVVYRGGDDRRGRRQLHARAAATGERRWTIDIDGIYRGDDGVFVAGRTVYYAGSAGNVRTLVAVDVDDGTERWRRTAAASGWAATPTLGSGVVALPLPGGLAAYHAETGARRWQRSGDRVTTPAAIGGWFVCGTRREGGGSLLAFDATDGTVVWRTDLGGRASGAPIATERTVYVATEEGTVAAHDLATGDRRWASAVDDRGSTVLAAAGDGALLVRDYRLRALDPDDGTGRWVSDRAWTGGRNNAPAVADGHGYVVHGDHLVVYDLVSGEERATVPLAGDTNRGVSIAGERVYVATREGVEAFE